MSNFSGESSSMTSGGNMAETAALLATSAAPTLPESSWISTPMMGAPGLLRGRDRGMAKGAGCGWCRFG